MPKRSGKQKPKCSPVASCESIGQTLTSIATSATSDATPHTSTSFAGGSPAKTSASPARGLASLVLEAAYGPNSAAWSTRFLLNGSLLKTWQAEHGTGSIPLSQTWGGSVTRRYRSRLRQAISEHCTAVRASSLLPTLSASDYGTSNNGDPGDHRESYATKDRLSLSSLAQSGELYLLLASQGLLPTLTIKGNYAKADGAKEGDGLWTALAKLGFRGPLAPSFCEWLMGTPIGWTDVLPSAMELFPNAPR